MTWLKNMVEYEIVKGGAAIPSAKEAGYRYLLGSNGVFIQAQNPVFDAVVEVGDSTWRDIPGLQSIEPYIRIKQGLIPETLLHAAHHRMAQEPDIEMHLQIVFHENAYHLVFIKSGEAYSVDDIDDADFGQVVMELHSHTAHMPAFFSRTDTDHALGFRLYAVIGYVGTEKAQAKIMLGVYGHLVTASYDGTFGGGRNTLVYPDALPGLVYVAKGGRN